jgi:hypothetical protein
MKACYRNTSSRKGERSVKNSESLIAGKIEIRQVLSCGI